MSRYHPLPWLESSSLPIGYTATEDRSYYGSSRPSAPTAAFTPRSRSHNTTRDFPNTQTFTIYHHQGLHLRNMANWNMVWLQPKAGPTAFDFSRSVAPGGRGSSDPEGLTGPEPLSPNMEKRVKQLCRPTLSSSLKRETPWMKRYHVMSYMDGDRVSWSKQELRKDVDSLMWKDNGTIRSHTKI